MSPSYPQHIDSELQERVLTLWKTGQVVAIPTETVYGLGADATNDEAVARIYAVKDRPRFNPLIVHVASVAVAERFAVWNARAEKLAKAFWPGPLTLVMKKREGISTLVTAGGDTVGIRIPRHPIALALLKAFDGGIAAPSANRSGRISPTCYAHVASELGAAVPLIVDGGACEVGLESTVVDISSEAAVLLRAGGITREAIEQCLREKLSAVDGDSSGILHSPGQLASHYAPRVPVRMHATHVEEGEGLLAFGAPLEHTGVSVNLSETGDLKEAAVRLFAALHTLDAADISRIAVMSIPEVGLGEAINDRLRRASAPRE